MREMRWTDEQVRALTEPGHVLLAASAGTGKTTTIVGKMLWLLGLEVGARRSDGTPVRPCPDPCGLDGIAAITFTEKAAYDLKRKLRKEIESSERGAELRWQVDRASVGTIHGFCGDLLREHALRLGIDPAFRILDEREARLRLDETIHEVVEERLQEDEPGAVELVRRFGLAGYGRRRGVADHVADVVRDVRWRAHRYDEWRGVDGTLDADLLERIAARHACRSEEDEAATHDRRALEDAVALHGIATEVVGRWLSWLEAENARDFDSLILDVRRLLTREETRPALESLRRRHRVLIIDEFQDTDGAQRDIAFAIAGVGGAATGERAASGGAGGGDASAPGGGPQLFLVGDPKQSVYRFRGADIAVWNQVAGVLCGDGEPLRLTHNFRSERPVVRFVNRVGGHAMEETARAIGPEAPESRVDYQPLLPFRKRTAAGFVEWLAVDVDAKKTGRSEAEARLVASRILELRGSVPVVDPDDEELRDCRLRDMAVLGRKKDNLAAVERALREYGIPYYNTATSGLGGRQEVIDLVTVLRLLDNPHDDLRACGFLRSPFAGLRDETLARIRLDPETGGGSLLGQARRFLAGASEGTPEPFPAPESPRVLEVELEALGRALGALAAVRPLADRADPVELLEDVLERTGYRLHLLLRTGADEALANIERFLSLLAEYRHLPLGSFLSLWDRWGDQDLGIPQAPLYSERDDVVTLSTIHTAKGLEWPVVFLVATEEGPRDGGGFTHSFFTDPLLGPVFMPKTKERGPRCERLFRRELLEERAEEARLLYVAATRARDRLVVSGPTESTKGYGDWLAVALGEARDAREWPEPAATGIDADAGIARPDTPIAEGAATRVPTGASAREDADGQLGLFAAAGAGGWGETVPAAEASPPDPPLVVVRRGPVSSVQARIEPPRIGLAWLDGIVDGAAPPLVRPIDAPVLSFTSSATELMMRERDPDGWELRYRHGVQPVWRFAPDPVAEPGLAPEVRGQVIHGVLERIEEEAEIGRVLEETISGIDAAEVEELLQPGTAYREALEREIEAVVASAEWRWYVAPPHDPDLHRELSFVHLVGAREWRQGAYDLYRPADPDTWIIDFKTHAIDAGRVEGTAREYDVQVRVYREAAAAILGSDAAPRVALHFTRPNVAVER